MPSFVILSLSIVFLAGCAKAPSGPYPITDGFHKTLPQGDTRTVVWGTNSTALGTAVTWLQKRRLTLVERAQLQKILDEQGIVLTHTTSDEARILRVSTLVKAALIVFVDATTTSAQSGRFVQVGEAARARVSTVYSAGVSVRGVNVETGEVLWSGNARYDGREANLDDMLAKLTCQALATAWGLRPAGKHAISSEDMCG